MIINIKHRKRNQYGVQSSWLFRMLLLILGLLLLPLNKVKASFLLDQYNKEVVSNDTIVKSLSKHVIIAFDDFVLPQFSNALLDGYGVRENIRKALCDLGLKEGDYYSLVNFSISAYSDDINNLVRPIKDSEGNDVTWRSFLSVEDVFKQNSWNEMIVVQGRNYVGWGAFSLLTGAKAYSLTSLRKNDGHYVNRTYLLMVTDDNYNGNDDYNKEFSTLWYENKNCKLSKDAFTKHCREVNLFYKFLYHSKYNIQKSGERSYDVHVYDVNPQSQVALPSVVNYPANLGLTQVNGGYRLKFNFSDASEDYITKRFQVIYFDRYGNEHITEYFSDTTAIIDIPSIEIGSEDSLKVLLRGWMLQNDKLYGGLLLSPDDPLLQRLNVPLKLELKNEAILFGAIPIPSVLWFFTDSATIAVTTWSVIAILLLVLFMWWLVRKLVYENTTYRPDNNQIVIKRVK